MPVLTAFLSFKFCVTIVIKTLEGNGAIAVTMFHSKVAVLLLGLTICANAAFHEISTKLGKIKGTIEKSVYDGSEFYAYRGIPYAKKLTENNKFQDSEPAGPWGDDILDATDFGSSCISIDMFKNEMDGSIDCLYLNVYVPKNRKSQSSLSSMVWIHGGAFLFGSGDDLLYGPDYFLKEDVVLVTLNYRLGPFGFLNLGTAAAPGNMGLKDQNRAIRFYKEVIAEAVGADPNEITIFGESAGAASVSYQVISPMSKGLFKRAIQQSGSSMDVWAFNGSPFKAINRTKILFNLTANDPAEIVKEMNEKMTSAKIVEHLMTMVNQSDMFIGALTFVPSKEEKIEGVEQFLPDHPHKLILDGNFNKVPTIIGVNSDEGILFATVTQKALASDPTGFMKIFPNDVADTMKDPVNSTSKLLEHYVGKKTITGNETELAQMMSDLLFLFSYWTSMNFLSQHNVPTYGYYFQYRTKGGLMKQMFGINESACVHGDDLFYMFYSNIVENKYQKGTNEYQLLDQFTKMWTNFAKTGNPTPEGSGLINWEKYNDGKKVLTIDKELSLINVTDIEEKFNSRMCWMLTLFTDEIQARFKQFGLC